MFPAWRSLRGVPSVAFPAWRSQRHFPNVTLPVLRSQPKKNMHLAAARALRRVFTWECQNRIFG